VYAAGCIHLHLFPTGTSTEGCCGSLLINTQSHECCSGDYGNKKPHKKEKNKKCCKTEYYNKEAHYCFRGRYVLPLFHKICGNQTYDTRIQKCCHRKLYDVSEDSQHYKCCGSSLHSDLEYKCCEGDPNFLIPHNASCCKKSKFFSVYVLHVKAIPIYKCEIVISKLNIRTNYTRDKSEWSLSN